MSFYLGKRRKSVTPNLGTYNIVHHKSLMAKNTGITTAIELVNTINKV